MSTAYEEPYELVAPRYGSRGQPFGMLASECPIERPTWQLCSCESTLVRNEAYEHPYGVILYPEG